MACLNALQEYGSDSSNSSDEIPLHLQTLDKGSNNKNSISNTICVVAAPEVAVKQSVVALAHIEPTTTVLHYNPKFEELYSPQVGPVNPHLTQQQRAHKNMLSGFAEPTHVNAFDFENQRRTFHVKGYATDPSFAEVPSSTEVVVGEKPAVEKDAPKKRKRVLNNDPADIEGYAGPWAKYKDEKGPAIPTEEEKEELDEILAKRSLKGKKTEEKPIEEKTTLHIPEALDYQGRSFLHPPHDVGVNLRTEFPPEKCFLPKKLIHTWTGHTKGVAAIRLYPKTGHLLLSCGLDAKVKLWEVYKERRCVRTYSGHRQAVRDICYNNSGERFISCSYDRFCKLWDTETGECISRFTSRKVPYCVKFHPEEEKQDLFVAGTSDKKIVCWDIRSGEVVQEYDRHLGAVNTITFVDQNRRFVTTSDDKSLRVWEWDVPVDFKYIADPSMHSMPAVTLSPNGKWLACQSMDNQIVIFNVLNRFKFMRKKVFKGHMVAGYACTLDFSPEMTYLISGDADGKVFFWDWKTCKLYHKFKAHDDVCSGVLWHPHETSKVITAGWDNLIKLWD